MKEEGGAMEHVDVVQGRVARVILRRPPLNVLNLEMLGELERAFRELIPTEPALVVLAAEGRAFSAGVDIADHTEDRVGGMLEIFHSVFVAMGALDVPLVALVQGPALGGGCELVTACDLVLASRSATFGQPEIKVGVFPPVAAVELQQVVGARRAAEMLFTGEPFSAQQAAAIGLVNRVLPDESFAEQAEAFLGLISRHSRPVLSFTKQALRLGRGRTLEEALPDLEVLYLDKLMQTQDAREGIRAFMEKRPPVFGDF
jgi:cyclohexa-1,5-dienecarbonyl-CoA hydratase